MLVVAFYMRALTVILAVGAASPPVPRVLIASPLWPYVIMMWPLVPLTPRWSFSFRLELWCLGSLEPEGD